MYAYNTVRSSAFLLLRAHNKNELAATRGYRALRLRSSQLRLQFFGFYTKDGGAHLRTWQ